nr:MAG TPA: hypothetical protein [Caudoviricetes sp.]
MFFLRNKISFIVLFSFFYEIGDSKNCTFILQYLIEGTIAIALFCGNNKV